MTLERIKGRLTVCKVADLAALDPGVDFYFVGRTDEEISLVCREEDVPAHTMAREDRWRGFRVTGVLDFSLTGVLAGLSGVLAKEKIGIFAVSTYNTDYILVKEENFERAMAALAAAGYPEAEE